MKLFVLLIFLTIPIARADLILSPGAGIATGMESDQESSGKSILNTSSGIGLQANAEWIPFRALTLGFGLGYFSHSGKTQFQNSQATVNELDTRVAQLNFEAGAKLRLINLRRFKVFVGGGVTLGSLNMNFDKSDFEEKKGDEVGYVMNESQSYNGYYLDTGVEYIFSNTSGLRVSLKNQRIKTSEFENLNNKELNLSTTNLLVQYMHYVNWDLFFK